MSMICISSDGRIMASEGMSVVSILSLTHTAFLSLFKSAVADQPEEYRDQATQELYDLYNETASAFLGVFAPDIELRPDLTTEAILKAENEILEAKAADITINLDEGIQGDISEAASRIKAEMEKDNVVPFKKEQ